VSETQRKTRRHPHPNSTLDLVPQGSLDPAKSVWKQDERHALARRAQAGDATVLPELRAMLDAHPDTTLRLTDVAYTAHTQMARAVAPPNDLLLVEVMPRRVAMLQRELEGPNPSPLERLLCERIATCWLAVYLFDAAAIQTGADGRQPSLQALELDERNKSRAHRRYLDACVALAKVRRLLGPVSQQVNIAEAGASQINVGLPHFG
jgi:hypothetical protein